MADKVKIDFLAGLDISEFKAQLGNLSKDMQKVNLGEGLATKLKDEKTELENAIKEYEKLKAKPVQSASDITKISDALDEVNKKAKRFITDLANAKGLNAEKLLPQKTIEAFEKLNKQIKDGKKYAEDYEKAQEKIAKQVRATADAEEKMNNAIKKNKEYSGKKGANTRKINQTEKKAQEALGTGNEYKHMIKIAQGMANSDKEASAQYKELSKDAKNYAKALRDLYKEKSKINSDEKSDNENAINAIENYNKQKAALDDLQTKFKELKDGKGDLDSVRESLKELTGGIDYSTAGPDELQKALEKLKETKVDELKDSLKAMGEQGTKAVEELASKMPQAADALQRYREEQEKVDRANRDISSLTSRISYTFSLIGIYQKLTQTIRSAYNSVKELDSVMTETATVTDFSVGDMWSQMPQYAKRADELGVAISDVYKASTLYYQQGLKTNEVTAVANETLKMAKIANIDAAEATNYMTAALRGFNMEINEASAGKVNDVYSELAKITASNTQEISVAMTKTASIAHSANMEFETTAAFLSQIIETTRESAETAGTAMKTVIARFQELKKSPSEIGEVEGEIVDANKIETALRSVGVALRDQTGQFRSLDSVFLDLAKKWDSLDKNTQRYIATIAAGSRQQSRFLAMMSNYDRTIELVTAANNSAGSSQAQFEKTTESLETALNRLKTAWTTFTTSIANQEAIKDTINLLSFLLKIVNGVINGISLGSSYLKTFWSAAALITGMKAAGKILTKGIMKAGEAFKLKGYAAGEAFKSQVALASAEMVRSAAVAGRTYRMNAQGLNLNNGINPKKLTYIGNGTNTAIVGKSKYTLRSITSGTKRQISQGLNAYTDNISQAKWNHYGFMAGKTNQDSSAFRALLGQKGGVKSASTFGSMASFGLGGLIGGLVGSELANKIFDKSIYTTSERTSDAKSVADITKNAAEATNQELSNLNEVKSSLQGNIKLLKTMAKGTAEWTVKAYETNSQISSIIAQFPELTQYTQSINGVLEISEEGWTAYSNKLQEQQNRLNTKTIIEAIDNSEIKRLKNIENLEDKGVNTSIITNKELKSIKTTSKVSGALAGTGAGLAVGAVIGSVIPVVGTAIGAVIGAVGGFVTSLIVGGIHTGIAQMGMDAEELNAIGRYAAENGLYSNGANNQEIINQLQGAGFNLTDEFKNLILESSSEFNQFVQSINQADLALQTYADQLGQATAQEQGLNKIDSDLFISIGQKYKDRLDESAITALLKNDKIKGIKDNKDTFKKLSDDQLTIMKSYAKENGYIFDEYLGKFTKDGQVVEVSGGTIKRWWAEGEAYNTWLNDTQAEFNKLRYGNTNNKTYETKKNMLLYSNGSIEDFTIQELEAYEQYLEEDKKEKNTKNEQEKDRIKSQILGARKINGNLEYVLDLVDAGLLEEKVNLMGKEKKYGYTELGKRILSKYNDNHLIKIPEYGSEREMNPLQAGELVDLIDDLFSFEYGYDHQLDYIDELKKTPYYTMASKRGISLSLAKGFYNSFGNLTDQGLGLYDQYFSNLSSEKKYSIDSLLSTTDLTAKESYKDIYDALVQLYGEGDDVVKQFEKFTNEMFQFDQVISKMSLSDLNNGLDQSLKVLQKISELNPTDTLSLTEEELTQMKERYAFNDNDILKNFVKWRDGTYRFIGDVNDLKLMLGNNIKSMLNGNNDYLNRERQTYELFQNKGNQNIEYGKYHNKTTKSFSQVLADLSTSREQNNSYNPLQLSEFLYTLYGADDLTSMLKERGIQVSETLAGVLKKGLTSSEYSALSSDDKKAVDEFVGTIMDEANNYLNDRNKYEQMLKENKELFAQTMPVLDAYNEGIATSSEAMNVYTAKIQENNLERRKNIKLATLEAQGYENMENTIKAATVAEKEQIDNVLALSKTVSDNYGDLNTGEGQSYDQAVQEVTKFAKQLFGNNITDEFVAQNINSFKELAGPNALDALYDLFGEASKGLFENGKELWDMIANIPEEGEAINGTWIDALGLNENNINEVREKLKAFGVQLVGDYAEIISGKGYIQIASIFTLMDELGKQTAQGWKENFDWLTNLLNDIKRTTNEIERLNIKQNQNSRSINEVNNETVGSLNQNRRNRANLITQQMANNKALIEQRKKQLENYQDALKKKGLDKYITYKPDGPDGVPTLTMNHDAIYGLNGDTSGTGELVDEYWGKMIDLVDEIDDKTTEDLNLQDDLYDLQREGLDEYLDIEQRLIDAIIYDRQKQIDDLKEVADSINEANTNILNKIQQGVSDFRNDRKLADDKENLDKQQNKLALLMSDTSGMNQLEILQLQDSLDQARQNYTDSLIDKNINEMTKQNEEAYKQRQNQIELMQAQLEWDKDNGEIAKQADTLITKAFGEEGTVDTAMMATITTLIKTAEGFDANGKYTGKESDQKLITTLGLAADYLWGIDITDKDAKKKIEEAKTKNNANIKDPIDTLMGADKITLSDIVTAIKNGGTGNGGKYIGSTFNPFSIGSNYDTIKYGLNENNIAKTVNSRLLAGSKVIGQTINDAGVAVVQLDAGDYGHLWINLTDFIGLNTTKYATGGLSTSTGPAWLDGTFSKPEYVLNATQTAAFLKLTDVLTEKDLNNNSMGNNYYNIEIQVDELANDYDVDDLAERVEERIVSASQYRNVNAVNLGRR